MNHKRQRTEKPRGALARRREGLYERVKTLRRENLEVTAVPGDVMDVAKSLVDAETQASIVELAEKQLAQIDYALARFDDGEYRICLDCGEGIPFERLKAIPSAIYCVDCQLKNAQENSRSRSARVRIAQAMRFTSVASREEVDEVLRRPLNALSTLLFATPALAQTNDPTMNEGAGVIAWIVVGLIGGYLASRVVNKTGEGTLRDIFLGIIGGIVGGLIFRALGGPGVTGFNFWSILVAFVGAAVVLLIFHAARGQRARV